MHILISGYRRGLGQALRQRFESLGHTVVGFSQSSPPPDQVDVSDAQAVETWVQHSLAQAVPDLVIANAGQVLVPQALWQTSSQDFSRILDVNVKGMFHLFRAILPSMLDRQKGVLVGLSSGYGRTTTARMSAYCTSKWAVEGLIKSLSAELPKSMAAVALDPGTLQTDMLRLALGDGARFFPTPEQWVERATSLLLGLGPQHNGQSLSVPASA